MSDVYSRRLKKELQEIQIEQADPAKRAAGASRHPTIPCAAVHDGHTRHLGWTGIQLLQADDLKTWFFSIEVLGESLYKVPFFSPLLVILQRDRPRPAPLPLPPASDIGHFFRNFL
jgi:hypothetical protein